MYVLYSLKGVTYICMNKLQLTWKNLKMLKKTTGYKRLSPL